MQKCEGEAVANNRKGKLIFFYEWDIVLEWTGTLKGGEKEVEGSINIPNLSEENNVSEVDVSVCIYLYILIAVINVPLYIIQLCFVRCNFVSINYHTKVVEIGCCPFIRRIVMKIIRASLLHVGVSQNKLY